MFFKKIKFFYLVAFLIVFATTGVFYYTQTPYKVLAQGERYFNQLQFKRALPYFVSATRLMPHNEKAANYLYLTYKILDDNKKLVNALKIFVQNNPDNIHYAVLLADNYYAGLKYDDAEKIYKKIIKLKTSFDNEKKLTEVLIWQKKYSEAIPLLDGLIKDDPRDYNLIELAADVAVWTKKYDKAILLYKSLLSNNYKTNEVSLKLADALRYAGRDDEAIDVYNKYLGEK